MVKITQNSFLGGQLDFEMMGRQDIDRYAKGATRLKNFIPLRRGGIRKRPGTDLRHDVTECVVSGKYRLVPFAYRKDEGWALLFTDGAILAFNRRTAVAVEAAEGVSFYTGSQVEELDYCQCGDVMYIAHQSHAPCRIEHVAAVGGAHAFTLKKVDTGLQSKGVPSIKSAQVSKMGVIAAGAMAKESYKVTAVFGGQETFPSATFSKNAKNGSGKCLDYDAGYDTWRAETQKKEKKGKVSALDYQPVLKTYSGTEYTMPWTQSQKITLEIGVATRSVGGAVEYPEQIRIYRKTGSVFGLVGHIDTSQYVGTTTAEVHSGNAATLTRIARKAGAALGNGIADGATGGAHGLGLDGFEVAGTLKLKIPNAVHSVRVSITPGAVSWAEATAEVEEDGESVTRLASIAYTYHRCPAGTFTVRLGSGTAKTVAVARQADAPADTTLTVARGEDETETDFRARAEAECTAWLKTTFAGDTAEAAFVAAAGSEASAMSDTLTVSFAATGDGTAFVASSVCVEGTPYRKSSFEWDDRFFTPDASVTPPKEEDVMSQAGDWPACVCLSQQRLIWASTANEPARVVMSAVGDFGAYAAHTVMTDDDPVDFQVSATRFPKVNHLVELRKLLLFDGDSEWVVDSASAASGLTYATVQARQHSSIGAAEWLKPLVCNNVLLFAERTGQAVRQYGYQLEDDGYGGEDVSIFSASIFRGRRITSWAYQQHPHSTCWCVLSDGTMCSLTFMREQQTIAWATHELGGGGKARAVVCTHALTGNANALSDTSQVFVLVQRGTAWTVEEMRRDCRHGSDTVANALCLDSARTLAAGDSVRAGAVVVDPRSGAVGSVAGAGLVEGFPFESEFTSVHPVTRSEVGLAQMDVKCVQEVHLRMSDAVGGAVRGIDVPAEQASRLEKTTKRVALGEDGAEDGAEPQYTGIVEFAAAADENVPLVTSNNRDGRITLTQSEPWPFTLLMLETDVECEEDERRAR